MKTYFKNIFRDMSSTKGKIASIFIMIFLASTVVVGLYLTGPSMRKTLNKTLIEYNHPDIVISSTYGLNTEDQVIIEEDKDIHKLSYSKTYDANYKDYLIKLKSYDSNNISKIYLVEGKLPENNKELALDSVLSDKFKVGQKIKFSSSGDNKIDEYLENTEYKIVGFIKSSEYLMEDIREISLSGKKMLDGFAIILEENFKKDTISEANIFYKESENLDKFSKKYYEFVKEKKKKLLNDFKNRPEEAIRKIKNDANKEIMDAEKQLENSEKEISDNEKKLDDAKISLENGFQEYEEGKKDFENQIKKAENTLISSKRELDNGYIELDKGKDKYNKSIDEFNRKIEEAEKQIEEGKKELNFGKEKLESAFLEYNQGLEKLEREFAEVKSELETSKFRLEDSRNTIDINRSNYEELLMNIEQLKESLINVSLDSQEYINISETIENMNYQAETIKSELEIAENEYNYNLAIYEASKLQFDQKYEENKKPLDKAKEELDKNKEEIDRREAELKNASETLENERISGLKELDAAKLKIQASEQELDKGFIEYNNGLKELENNKIIGNDKLKSSYQELIRNQKQYEDNKKEFDEKVKDAREEISEGRKEVEDSKENLLKLVDPVYSIKHNRDNKSILTYYRNSQNIDELSKIFPSFFYLVAILVTLTTMKRYIDEQRSHTGTLKSLGYSNRDIANKFYIYGLFPTILASILGAGLARFVLTKIIFNAYSSGFDVLDIQYSNSLLISLVTILISLILIFLTIYITNRRTVKEVTADLLRERAPKQGSRIFLERIKPIWKRLSFMHKVTFRNLFRYKSRMFMTIFGIGGCTALIFFGFAMQDAIKDTSSIQRNEITQYDALTILDENAKKEDIENYEDSISGQKTTKISYQTGQIETEDGKLDTNLIVFNSKTDANDFINIRNLKKNKIEIEDSGAIITENISNKGKIKVGDFINFEDENGEFKEIKINAIAENYLEDYIYISEKQYEEVFSENPSFNSDLIKIDDKSFINKLESEPAVQAIIEPNSSYNTIDGLMKNLNLVIVIITLISSILAIVVLFNLTNINVSERIRELATTKVLGFYPKETTAYIYRETFILTIIGIFLGYLIGYLIFRYVLNVVAPEGILIAYHPHLKSYIISAAITFGISLIIMMIVHKLLKSIDMAQAMKSGE